MLKKQFIVATAMLGTLLASLALVQRAQAQTAVVVNDHPVCAALAYVRDQAVRGFPDIKGIELDSSDLRSSTRFVSTYSLRQDVGGRLLVKSDGSAVNTYYATFRYGNNLELGRHLGYWQEIVEGCYGASLSVQCGGQACTTNPPIFRWSMRSNGRVPEGDVFIREAPLLEGEAMVLERLPRPDQTPLPAPRRGETPWSLLSDLVASRRDPVGYINRAIDNATPAPFSGPPPPGSPAVSERREPIWRGGSTMVYRYSSVPTGAVIPISVHEGKDTEVNVDRPELLGIKRIHLWNRQLYGYTPEELANTEQVTRVNALYQADLASALGAGAKFLTCIYESGQEAGHIVEYWHRTVPVAARRDGLDGEPSHPFLKLRGARADCPPRYIAP